MRHRLPALSLALLALPSVGVAQGLGVTWTGELVLFDTATGEVGTVVHTTTDEWNGMARTADGRLFAGAGTNPPKVVEIDAKTGEVRDEFAGGLVDLRSMAGHPTLPTLLFAVKGGPGNRDLYALEVGAGTITTTYIGQMDHTGVQGLTFAPDGTLYGWSTGFGLITIDPLNAASTDVNGAQDGTSEIQSLAWWDGKLYGIREALYEIDVATGVPVMVLPGPLGDVRGAEIGDVGGSYSYCTTSPNSAGPGALIQAAGSHSIADDAFELRVTGCPPGQFGLFFYGPVREDVPLGDGTRCVGTGGVGLFRFPVFHTDSAGEAVQHVDFDAPPANAGPGKIVPGTTFHFQAWYRDGAAGGTGSNLSDGLGTIFRA